MGDNNQGCYGCGSIGCGFLVLALFALAGWLVYGALASGFWVALLWLGLGLTALVGLVPVAGPFLYWNLASDTVLPAIMAAGGLTSTWLTTAALWLGLIGSIFWTVAAVVILLYIAASVLDLT